MKSDADDEATVAVAVVVNASADVVSLTAVIVVALTDVGCV